VTVFAVEVSQLAEVVWVSALAGIAITTTYSVAVFGAGRYLEATRTGRRRAAFAYGALAGGFLLVFLGGLIWGVVIMLAK
jgi:phosphatidylglycerophosphate synthase